MKYRQSICFIILLNAVITEPDFTCTVEALSVLPYNERLDADDNFVIKPATPYFFDNNNYV